MIDREIFMNAPAGATPEVLAAYLDKMCGEDRELRARVEELIAADDDAGSFLGSPALADASTLHDEVSIAEKEGETIGSYKLLQKIGEGGFGVVYMADQLKPVKRRVALKIIKLGMDTRQVVARFEAERQALAMMDHPNIAKVHDAGSTETGRPFFVMELVKGVPITTFCDEQNLSTEERLELFVDVCRAVQHAHQKGIIHRDLKPSNVMVTLHDDKAVVKVIDFGVAKATQMELTEKTLYTRYEQFIGTPAYMSPEQAQLSGLDIDTRSDIYALGVLLYELLTGRTPFDSKELLSAGYDEIRRIIREEEPPKPSTRVSTLENEALTILAKCRKSEPAKLRALLRGDLDWIVMKALEKDRTRRYDTANALAMDVWRYLDDEPVLAAAPGAGYRLSKYIKRHRGTVYTAAAIILLLVVGMAVSSWQWRRALLAERDATEKASSEAVARGEAQAERALAETRLVEMKVAEGHHLHQEGDHFAAMTSFAEALGIVTSANETPLVSPLHEFRLRAMVAHAPRVAGIWSAGGEVTAADLSPDGRRLVTAVRLPSGRAEARVWDVALGRPLTPPIPSEVPFTVVAFSPQGDRIVIGGEDGMARVWDAITGTPRTEPLAHPGPVSTARFSGSGEHIVTASRAAGLQSKGVVVIWDAETGRKVDALERAGFVPTYARFLPAEPGRETSDRDVLYAGLRSDLMRGLLEGQGGVRIEIARDVRAIEYDETLSRMLVVGRFGHDLEPGATVYEVTPNSPQPGPLIRHGDLVVDGALSPDGSWVATASRDQTARVWDTASGEAVSPPLRHRQAVDWIEFSGDGRRVLSTDREGFARVWDARSGAPCSPWLPHGSRTLLCQFSPDDGSVISVCHDGLIRVWDLRGLAPELCVVPEPSVRSADFDWASRHSLVVLENDSLELRDEQAVRVQLPASLSGNVDRAAFCSGGQLFLAGRKDGLVEVFDRASGEQVGQPWGHDGPLSNLVVSDAGDKVATVRVDRVMVWDVLTGSSSSPFVHGHLVKDLAFHPDGSQLATAGARGQVIVWDLAAARPVRDPIGHEEGVSWVRFLDGGRSLLSVTESGTGYLWELGEPEIRKGIFRHGSPLTALAHNKEGTLVATAGSDLNVRIWDARLGDARTGLLAHPSAVNDLVFHPSLPILATAAADGMTRIWDMGNGELLFEGFAHLDAIRQVEFEDDGSVLATVGAEGAVCFWSLGWDGRSATGEVAEFVRAASPLPHGDLPGFVRRREQHGHHFEVSPLRRRSWLEQRRMADRRWDSREAGLASREGNWERAIGLFDRFLESGGGGAPALEARGWASAFAGRPAEGLEFFSRAHEVDPARRLPLLAAFCLNRLIGDELATEASFLELIRPTKLASGYSLNTVAPTWNSLADSEIDEWRLLPRYRTQLKSLGVDGQTLRMMDALALIFLERPDEGRQAFADLQRDYPEVGYLSEALLRLVLNRGGNLRALELANGILDRQPGNASARFYRGSILWSRGELDQAGEDIARAIAAEPENIVFHHEASMLYTKRWRLQQAADSCDVVSRLEPDEQLALIQGASMAWDSGAVDSFSRYCHELMTRYRDTGFGGQEDIQEAERAAKRCLLVPSENYGVEDFERALILAERAFSWVGHTVSWLDGPLSIVGGMASYRRGDYEEALERLPVPRQGQNLPPESMLFRAMTLHKLGRPAEAHEAVKEIGTQLISYFSADLYPGSGSYLGPLSVAQNSRELEEILLNSLKAGVGSAAGANEDTWNSLVLLADALNQCRPVSRFGPRAKSLYERLFAVAGAEPSLRPKLGEVVANAVSERLTTTAKSDRSLAGWLCEEALKSVPTDPTLLEIVAYHRLFEGDLAGAQAAITRSGKDGQEWAGGPEACYVRALGLSGRGQGEEAYRAFREAMTAPGSGPGGSPFFQKLGVALPNFDSAEELARNGAAGVGAGLERTTNRIRVADWFTRCASELDPGNPEVQKHRREVVAVLIEEWVGMKETEAQSLGSARETKAAFAAGVAALAGRAIGVTLDPPAHSWAAFVPTAVHEILKSHGASPEPVPLVSAGSPWHYLDGGLVAGPGWFDAEFDDRGWKSGRGELGFGDYDEITTIDGDGTGAITFYFRHQFEGREGSAAASSRCVLMRVLCDDGAVVYLNGQEVERVRMPEGAIEASTLALGPAVTGVAEKSFVEWAIDPSRLRKGSNLVAVEVHQVNPDSSDVSFDLELLLVPSLASTLARLPEDVLAVAVDEVSSILPMEERERMVREPIRKLLGASAD